MFYYYLKVVGTNNVQHCFFGYKNRIVLLAKMSKRPEYLAPPDIFYNDERVRKYATSSRMAEIQMQLCERAIELLCLPEDETCQILDIGCGTGLSGSVISDQGHHWVGIDISQAMLNLAKEDDEMDGDLILNDMGQGLPFKAGTFDGAVSISALQWLCNEDMSCHNFRRRLSKFFTSLYVCLARNARAVLQFYPENKKQADIIHKQATAAGFFGGLLIDYPNSSKAKKHYLVLDTGGVPKQMIRPLGVNESNCIKNTSQRMRNLKRKDKNKKHMKSIKEYIFDKKEKNRKKGKTVCNDSKFSGRRRRVAF